MILKQGKLSGGKQGHLGIKEMISIIRNPTNVHIILRGIIQDKDIHLLPIIQA